jgi:uncharacterized protein (UPF0261 family)
VSERLSILLVGTFDTKQAELQFLVQHLTALGASMITMDVGVLPSASRQVESLQTSQHWTNAQVAQAANLTLDQVANSGDENSAMQLMAKGATTVAQGLVADGRINGVLILGGTMGTDLALELCMGLPLGFPKVVLSTIAFSPLLPPERIAPDLIMVLWSGGLYGLNKLSKSALAQAAGAVVGAANAALEKERSKRPVIGMTSLGSSALKYMVHLSPALEERGFDLAVFHTTGMGGRAFETMAEQGQFDLVMDFSLQELVNHLGGSLVSSGPTRLTAAGLRGIPQIVAPGATDMIDYPTWGTKPERFADRPSHDHNRLIASVCIDATMRREVADAIVDRLAKAQAPVVLILPLGGIEEWDRPGAALEDRPALAALFDQIRLRVKQLPDGHPIELVETEAHINDPEFALLVLNVLQRLVQ